MTSSPVMKDLDVLENHLLGRRPQGEVDIVDELRFDRAPEAFSDGVVPAVDVEVAFQQVVGDRERVLRIGGVPEAFLPPRRHVVRAHQPDDALALVLRPASLRSAWMRGGPYVQRLATCEFTISFVSAWSFVAGFDG